MTHLRTLTSLGLACAFVGGTASAQIFVRNTSDVPSQNVGPARYTENVDFADIDLDGDWDAAFANGGDLGNLQDRLWVNQGGSQGGTIGVFVDETASRYPTLSRDGRDVEFVDFDADGDVDVYVSNTSTNSNQGNTWFVNGGGIQGGSAGFFTDDTSARWVGLGGAGSSIAPSQLVGGSFIDWSCDCDFGDLDNDGDMDLVHSTYGGSFNGQVPTRIFLNDGTGHFSEFNPSGFQLAGSQIQNGNPGLWCEGVHNQNTNNNNGIACDIATNTLDIDLGDVDGDFDLDILHGDRSQPTRFFNNRLEENGGTLGFRDVTTAVYPANWSNGEGHYEQEMADFDGDGDLDIYGLNWQAGGFNFDDIVMDNIGNNSGTFSSFTVLSNSGTDDNEGDFVDYDNDGDMDLYVANFSGIDRLYRNNGVNGGTFTFISNGTSGLNALPFTNTSLDADACDVDFDGDYDVFASQDTNRPVVFWENTNGTPDTTASYIPNVEDIGNQTAGIAGSDDFPVRAHVYDNAPYYITWYNDTEVEISVDGTVIDTLDAKTVGGQIFRAEIPSNLVGNVEYTFRSTDEYGNTGTSATTSYTASTGLTKDITYGTGDMSSGGNTGSLAARSLFTAGKPLYVELDTDGVPYFYVLAIATAPFAPTPIPGLGTVNINGTTVLTNILGVTNGLTGKAVRKFNIDSSVPSGFSIFLQAFFLDEDASGNLFASEGLEIPSH